jgi:uncharacterized membrane protein YesL
MTKSPKFSGAYSSFSCIVDIIYIGLLWLVCCLPIITVGPACTAMYYTMVKCVRRGRGHVTGEFFAAFRRNFLPSLKVWLIFLLLICLWLSNLIINGQTDPEGAKIMGSVSNLLIIPPCFPMSWAFAYISRFDNSLGDTLKFSLFLSIKNFMRTVIILLTGVAFALIVWMFPALLPLLPGFACLVISLHTEPVFKDITAEFENDGNEDKWYNE